MVSSDLLEEAGGYVALGMFSDAWEATEELPPEERTSEPALVIRLQVLTGLAQWELGEHVASLLVHAGEESRQTVARFHHARARCLYQSGDYDSARKEIRRDWPVAISAG